MAALIVPFKSSPLQPSHGENDSRRSPSSSLAHAQRIVAQIEREIAARAYRQAQLSYKRIDNIPAQVIPAQIIEMETQASIARRILNAIKALAYSA